MATRPTRQHPLNRGNSGQGKPKPRPAAGKRPAKRTPAKSKGVAAPVASGTPAKKSLANLFNPKNLQETLKTVGNLRGSVKQWLAYLQQADQLLDTLFITSTSLKETGVLEKLIKGKGKNLSTEDFTNILVALMNTPMGAQLFKGSSNDESVEPASK